MFQLANLAKSKQVVVQGLKLLPSMSRKLIKIIPIGQNGFGHVAHTEIKGRVKVAEQL